MWLIKIVTYTYFENRWDKPWNGEMLGAKGIQFWVSIGWQSHIFGIVIILIFSCPCIQKVTSPMVQGSFCGWEAQLVQAHQTFFMPGTRSESARTPQCPELGWIISVLIFGSEARSDRSSCKNNYPPHRAPSYELVYNILKHFTTLFSTCI
jgi:hypothetical protein